MNSKKQQISKAQSPYLNARKEWMERYGDYISSANSWRLATFGMLIIAGMAVAAFIWKSNEQSVIPYIIETNSLGEVTRLSKATIASEPSAPIIRASLRNWLIGARTVYVDLRAEQDIINQTYSMTLPKSPAYTQLTEYHKDNDPYARAVQETVEVQVNAIVPVSSETWQIEWTETRRSRNGALLDTKLWQATATVVLATPATEEQIMNNPTGLFVKQFAWTTRL